MDLVTTMDIVLHQLRFSQYSSAFQKYINIGSLLVNRRQVLKTISVQNESHHQQDILCGMSRLQPKIVSAIQCAFDASFGEWNSDIDVWYVARW